MFFKRAPLLQATLDERPVWKGITGSAIMLMKKEWVIRNIDSLTINIIYYYIICVGEFYGKENKKEYAN